MYYHCMNAKANPTPANDLPDSAENGFYSGDNWKLDESIGYLIRKLTVSMQRHIDAKLQSRGLTDSQWKPLLMIAHGKGDTASALAREMSIDAGAVSRMIDRLEAKGLIQRVWCKEDRRVTYLELTAQGREIAQTLPATLAVVLNHHLRSFSRDEVLQLKSQLRRMLENGGDPLADALPRE